MKPVALSKTAIISFIFDELFIKLWKVSDLMRRRLKMVIEGKYAALTCSSTNLGETIDFNWENLQFMMYFPDYIELD